MGALWRLRGDGRKQTPVRSSSTAVPDLFRLLIVLVAERVAEKWISLAVAGDR
jgi:hypothetical protein